MIITTMEFLARTEIDRGTLDVWIEEQWLMPSVSTPKYAFSETDLARAQLIRDLMDDLGVNAEGVGIILNLVDQVHGLRNILADLVQAARNAQN